MITEILILIGVSGLAVLGYAIWAYCAWKWVEYMHKQLHKSRRKIRTRNP